MTELTLPLTRDQEIIYRNGDRGRILCVDRPNAGWPVLSMSLSGDVHTHPPDGGFTNYLKSDLDIVADYAKPEPRLLTQRFVVKNRNKLLFRLTDGGAWYAVTCISEDRAFFRAYGASWEELKHDWEMSLDDGDTWRECVLPEDWQEGGETND